MNDSLHHAEIYNVQGVFFFFEIIEKKFSFQILNKLYLSLSIKSAIFKNK